MSSPRLVIRYLIDCLGEEAYEILSDLADDLKAGDESVLPLFRDALGTLPESLFVSDDDGSLHTWPADGEEPRVTITRSEMACLVFGEVGARL